MTSLVAYGATFFLGLTHAFEPGHGKSFLAAFSLRQSNLRVFGALIMSLFSSHFLVLSLIALVIQSITSTRIIEDYSHQMRVIAPLLVIAFGGYLLYQAMKHRKTSSGCSCGRHHANPDVTSARNASITGFVTGLMPCPTAVAPLIIAGAHGGFQSTIVHVLVYVIGMTSALFVFTAVLLFLKTYFQKRFQLLGGNINVNLISAVIMIVIGVMYMFMNLMAPENHFH